MPVTAAIITASAALISTGIATASKETTDCGKICRTKCRETTGILFSGRTECKRQCKAYCMSELSSEQQQAEKQEEEKQRKQAVALYTIGGIILFIALIFVAYKFFKK